MKIFIFFIIIILTGAFPISSKLEVVRRAPRRSNSRYNRYIDQSHEIISSKVNRGFRRAKSSVAYDNNYRRLQVLLKMAKQNPDNTMIKNQLQKFSYEFLCRTNQVTQSYRKRSC
jgi:hypothetical protein